VNVRERYLAALRGEPVDRVPLRLEGFTAPARSELAKIDDPVRREIAERAFDHVPAFIGRDTFVNRHLVTPPRFIRKVREEDRSDGVYTTTEITTPKGTLTYVDAVKTGVLTNWNVKYPVNSREDLDALCSIPWELPHGLGPARRVGIEWETVAHNVHQIHVSTPMVCVAGAMPFQMFLELCASDLPLVEELTALCEERIMRILDVALEGDEVDQVWIGGSEWLTPPMASPKLYDLLVFPQETRIIERAHRSGAVVQVHCHGNVAGVLDRIIESGANFLEPMEPPPDGDITFADAKRRAAGRIALGGNVEARVLEHGDTPEVERASRAAFEGGGHRMVFKTTAGPIMRMDERARKNYHTMLDVWEELSPEVA